MMNNGITTNAKKATQYIFLVCGLAISSWAPMVPFAKERLRLNDGNLGLLLLLLGAGAISMMPPEWILFEALWYTHRYPDFRTYQLVAAAAGNSGA